MVLALEMEEGNRETESVAVDEAVKRPVGEELSSWRWLWRWKVTESVAVDEVVRRAEQLARNSVVGVGVGVGGGRPQRDRVSR